MDEYELTDLVLADLGTIQRRAVAKTLTEEDFLELMARARRNLLNVRDLITGLDEPAIELTDAGIAALATPPRRLDARGLLARIPGLMTGRQLPSPARMRSVTDGTRRLGIVDGGRS